MKENAIEKYLREQVKLRGGLAVKLDPAGYKGIPDRLVLLPYGRAYFVELKRPKGGRLSPTQKVWLDWLDMAGYEVAVLATKEEIDQWLGAYDARY